MPDTQTETVPVFDPQGPVAKPHAGATGRPPEPRADNRLVEADLLIEDVSIDGMCGVY